MEDKGFKLMVWAFMGVIGMLAMEPSDKSRLLLVWRLMFSKDESLVLAV